jgi:hypothetical protein
MKGFALVLTVAAAVMAFSCRSSGGGSSTSAPRSYQTRSNEGEVALELTPQVLADGTLKISVRATTHSGDLAELNLANALALNAEGKTYRPVSATPLAGHHASGSVTFALARIPDSFVVTVTGVRTMATLKFEWP